MRISAQNQNFTSRKLPRNLYHLTNDKALKGIVDLGMIIPNKKDYHFQKEAIFLLEPDNFLKNWTGTTIHGFDISFIAEILGHASGDNKLACVKIPTETLDKDSLFLRSIKRLYQPINTFEDMFHVQKGESAIKRNLYRQRREPIEFVYTKPLSIGESEVFIGEKTPRFSGMSYDEQRRSALETLKALFKGHSEEIPIQKELDRLV